jgi:hypothetical protein
VPLLGCCIQVTPAAKGRAWNINFGCRTSCRHLLLSVARCFLLLVEGCFLHTVVAQQSVTQVCPAGQPQLQPQLRLRSKLNCAKLTLEPCWDVHPRRLYSRVELQSVDLLVAV